MLGMTQSPDRGLRDIAASLQQAQPQRHGKLLDVAYLAVERVSAVDIQSPVSRGRPQGGPW